jgi:two-component system, cell cycle response regulator DivK
MTFNPPRPPAAFTGVLGRTVLIVEDDDLNMKLFNDVLEAQGYRVLQTRDGLDALNLAREHRPDLVLMDIRLHEVSGLEITKRMKADPELRAIPVVVVTAFAMKGDAEWILESGCEDYLPKPTPIATLIETVGRILSKRQPAAA